MNKRILLFSILLLLAAGGRFLFLHAGNFLSVVEEPGKADIIICLNGDKDTVPKAVELFKEGHADRILVTYVETGELITALGVPEEAVLSLNSRPESTYEEALGAVDLMEREQFHSAIIVSGPFHMRRVNWTFDHLADDSMSMSYTTYEALWANGFWWDDTRSRQTALRELPKIIYYWVGHGLFGITRDPPWFTTVERWYNKVLLRFV